MTVWISMAFKAKSSMHCEYIFPTEELNSTGSTYFVLVVVVLLYKICFDMCHI